MERSELLRQYLAMPSEQRAAFLDAHCQDDGETRGWLREQLEKGLDATASAGREVAAEESQVSGFQLETLTSDGQFSSDQSIALQQDASETFTNGLVIGPYKILDTLGEGGMGTVFLAEQKQPVARRVALKVIKAAAGSKEVLARFEAERQAMAMMNHPNIARILDAGTTHDGQPFFAMELVQGKPITEYCDRNRLSINDRLKLFCDVCAGVQHAHQKGIIHRDLKPSNILVAVIDGQAVAKVIDFGLAKAMESTQKLTDQSLFTGIGQVLGTLKYMSPEQAGLNTLDIDTRTDIYALGIILYELLTGQTPIDSDTIKGQAILKVLELIREKEPVKPSSRLSHNGAEAISSLTQLRRTDLKRIQRELTGDLDWIVMKALEKDRTRRYGSASGFADDIQRYLGNEPIEARPPSFNYRVTKFVKKYRAGVLAASLLFISLLGGVAGTTFNMLRAQTAEELAERRLDETLDAKEAAEKAADLERAAKAESDRKRLEADQSLARTNFLFALARWEQNRVREARMLLDYVPQSYQGFEWYLAKNQFEGSYLTCYGHAASIQAVAVSPDGKQIVTGDEDGIVKLWDFATGDELKSLQGHFMAVTCVAFSPDSHRIATGSDDATITLWDAKTGNELNRLEGHGDEVHCLAFSPDGRFLASGSADCLVKVWDTKSGVENQSLKGHTGDIRSISFSPDGVSLASCGWDRKLRLWDLATGSELWNGRGASDSFNCVAFSPDGQRIAAASGGHIKQWEFNSGRELLEFQGHDGAVNCIAFSPDGTCLASGNTGSTIKLSDAMTGQELRTYKGHTQSVTGVAFSPDATRIASVSEDGTLKLWDATTEQQMLQRKGEDATSLACNHDGTQIVVGTKDGKVKLRDVLTGKDIRTFQPAGGRVPCVDYCHAGQLIAAATDASVRIWDAETGGQIHLLSGHVDRITSLSFSPDGSQLASGDAEGTIKLWDISQGKELRSFHGPQDEVTSLVFNPAGTHVASSGWDSPISLWEIETGEEQFVLSGHPSSVTDIGFSPDGSRIVSGDWRGMIKIWDTTTGRELRTFQGHSKGVLCVAFSPDGDRVVSSGEDLAIKFWDPSTGREIYAIETSAAAVQGFSISPDGTKLIDNSLGIWDAASNKQIRRLSGHSADVISVACSMNGRYIASGSRDNTLRLWETNSGQILKTIDLQSATANVLAFSPDNSRLAAASQDGKIRLWDTSNWQELLLFSAGGDRVSDIAFSPDSQQLVSGGVEVVVKLWDVSTGQELLTLQEQQDYWISTIFFSTDGAQVYSQTEFSGLIGWDVKTGAALEIGNIGEQVIFKKSENLSKDGRWLAMKSGSDVLLADLKHQPSSFQRGVYEFKSGLKADWHLEQAKIAKQRNNQHSELFHLYWSLKGDSGSAYPFYREHEVRQDWGMSEQVLNLIIESRDRSENSRIEIESLELCQQLLEEVKAGATSPPIGREITVVSPSQSHHQETFDQLTALGYVPIDAEVHIVEGSWTCRCRYRKQLPRSQSNWVFRNSIPDEAFQAVDFHNSAQGLVLDLHQEYQWNGKTFHLASWKAVDVVGIDIPLTNLRQFAVEAAANYEYQDAEKYWRQILEIRRKQGHDLLTQSAVGNLIDVINKNGEAGRAQETAKQAGYLNSKTFQLEGPVATKVVNDAVTQYLVQDEGYQIDAYEVPDKLVGPNFEYSITFSKSEGDRWEALAAVSSEQFAQSDQANRARGMELIQHSIGELNGRSLHFAVWKK